MKIQRDPKVPVSFGEWFLLFFFGWWNRGWVYIKKDDPRFKYIELRPVQGEGDPAQPSTRWWNKRLLVSRWKKVIVVKFVTNVDTQDSFIARDDRFGKRMIHLLCPIPPEKQVALRMGRETADFCFLVHQWTMATCGIEFIGYTTVDELKSKYPAAVLL